METHFALLKKFYNAAQPGSFTSPQKYSKGLQREGIQLPEQQIKTWLASQKAYTIHRSRRKRFPRRPIQSFFPLQFVEIDLMDMQKLAPYNDGTRYLIVSICVFSKFAWVTPIPNKQMTTVVDAYRDQLFKTGQISLNLRCDKGSEFLNHEFKQMCEDFGINLYTSNNEVKCAVVERFIRTLRGKLSKYLSYHNTNRYIHDLQALVRSYNNTYHSSIKMSPERALNHADFGRVFENQYRRKDFRVHVGRIMNKADNVRAGDFVRISTLKQRFAKESDPNFTPETFKVWKITYNFNEPVYHLVDMANENIRGTFSKHEIQKISKP
jgi:hypothetical protein